MKSGQLLRQVVNQLHAGVHFNSPKDRHLFAELYEQLLCDLQNAGNAGKYYTPCAVILFMVKMIDQDIWFYEHRVPEGQKAHSMTRPIRLDHLKACADRWGGAARKERVETDCA